MNLTEIYTGKTIEDLHKFADSLSNEYKNADPFPNIYIDDFFKVEELNKVIEEFPDLDKIKSVKFNNAYEKKLASEGEYLFGNETLKLMHFLNSQPMLEFLERLTGIKNLIPDPLFVGGGHHEIKPGGFLKIHADFNFHPKYNLDRRINLLLYLNKDWEEEYGGHFELWDTNMQGSVKKILPLFNRIAMFSTTSNSYHGHPNPLNCPNDRSRRSLALYYYTNGRDDGNLSNEHSTLFKQRPNSDDSKDNDGTSFQSNIKKNIKKILPESVINKLKKNK